MFDNLFFNTYLADVMEPEIEFSSLNNCFWIHYESGRLVSDRIANVEYVSNPLNGWRKFMPVEDHDRIVVELRAEVEKLRHDCGNHNISQADIDWCVLCDRKSNEATIATQARVIEIAKRVLNNAGLRPPDGGTPTVETICEDLSDAMTEIAAIEKSAGI